MKVSSSTTEEGRLLFDIKTDMNPKSWLSKYRRTSVGYLTIMFLFYFGISLILYYVIGVFIIENLIPNYEPPLIVLSLDLAVTAGPIEDTLFFGIPFYASF